MSVPEAGELVAYLVDPGRDLDPSNVGGAFYGAIDIGAGFRVTMGGVTAFTGKIDQIAHDLNPPRAPGADPIPLARIAAVDGIAGAAAVDTIPSPTFPQETTSARVGRLLDGAGIATGSGQRDIQAGGQTLQAGALVNDVWSDLLAVVQNEIGSIDFRPDGKVVYRIRATTWARTAPVLHLGCDDPDSSAELALNSLRFMTERSTIRNRVSTARAGGSAVVLEDAPSIAKYSLRASQRHDLVLLDDAAAGSWGAFVLNRMRRPSRAIENVSVTAGDAGVAAIEAVPLYTGRVHVYQEDYGTPIDLVYRLLGVAWDIDDHANATATLTLSADTAVAPTARTATFDTDAQWTAGMGAAAGSVGWAVSGGALRAATFGELDTSTGGVDKFTITWTADL
jgi:hypothetical protein